MPPAISPSNTSLGSREFGDRAGICYSLADLGEIARLHGDLTSARMLLEESIRAIPEGTDVYSLLISLHRLGGVARLEGDLEAATDLEMESLRLARQANDVANISQALEGLAHIAVAQAKHDRAVFLFTASAANRTRVDAPIPDLSEARARRRYRPKSRRAQPIFLPRRHRPVA